MHIVFNLTRTLNEGVLQLTANYCIYIVNDCDTNMVSIGLVMGCVLLLACSVESRLRKYNLLC